VAFIILFFFSTCRALDQCNCGAEAFVNIGDFCIATIFGKVLEDFDPLSYVTPRQWEEVTDYYGRRYLQFDENNKKADTYMEQAFLIIANDEVIFVDTSFNYLYRNYHTVDALKHLGCFSKLTKIVITHIQHSTFIYEAVGLNEKLLHEMDAPVYLSKAEYETWHAGEENENMRKFDEAAFQEEKSSREERSLPIDKIFERLEADDLLQLMSGEFELSHGIDALPCPRVTIGNFCIHIQSIENSHALLVGGVLMHESQVQTTDWHSKYDWDPLQAEKIRKEIIEFAAAANMLVFSTAVTSCPGIFTISYDPKSASGFMPATIVPRGSDFFCPFNLRTGSGIIENI